jgi:hypothetical protein
MVNHPNRSRKPKITDLSNIPVTEVGITEQQMKCALASLMKADKNKRYAELLKAHIKALVDGTDFVNGERTVDPALVAVCMNIEFARENPNGEIARICRKRGLLDALDGEYMAYRSDKEH